MLVVSYTPIVAVVEFLTFDIPAYLHSKWIEKDHQVWTRFLRSVPGFLSKEVWRRVSPPRPASPSPVPERLEPWGQNRPNHSPHSPSHAPQSQEEIAGSSPPSYSDQIFVVIWWKDRKSWDQVSAQQITEIDEQMGEFFFPPTLTEYQLCQPSSPPDTDSVSSTS